MNDHGQVWLAGLLLLGLAGTAGAAEGPPADAVPDYRPVPAWPRLPDGLELGEVSAVAADAADRV
jgi:hypothetical protein